MSSLIGETKNNSINKVSINDLFKNRYQPRKIFDETKLQELVKSIQERGILQPIVVRNHNNIEGKYRNYCGRKEMVSC